METHMSDPFGRRKDCEACTSMSDLCEIKFGNLDPLLNYNISTTPQGGVELVVDEGSSFKVTNNGDGTGSITTSAGTLPVITAPVDYCTKFNECFESPVEGPLTAATNWQTAANLTSTCLKDVKEAVAALQALNPVVNTEVIAGSSDILVTYRDGTTEILDLPEFSATNDVEGDTTFNLNGALFGPFASGPHTIDTDTDTFTTWAVNPDGTVTATDVNGVDYTIDQGAHTVDTDTFASQVDNGDGTVTVTYADGSTATYATGPHTVDTDTTYAFTTSASGAVTITGSDGTTFTGPPNTVDTDTFSTLAGQTITFANGDTLTVPDDTFAIARTVLGAQTDFNGDAIPAGSKVLELPNGDLVCLAEDRRTEFVCDDPDMTIREVNAKDGSTVFEETFSANLNRQFLLHSTLPFQTEADAAYVTVGTTTLVNDSAIAKRVFALETSAISGQAIDPTTGRLGLASRLVVAGTNNGPGTGVSDSFLTNVDEQADNQYIANYLFTIQPGSTTVEWQKRMTDVTNTNARHSNSRIIFIWAELACA